MIPAQRRAKILDLVRRQGGATGRWTSLSGVNVTLGLPIIRTSVDHCTAFDIAGKGLANAQSMVEAIELAARLAEARPAAREVAGKVGVQ